MYSMKRLTNHMTVALLLTGVVFIATSCDDNEDTTPQPPDLSAWTDLTADNAYANCFIVETAGQYRIEPKKVDGSAINDIASADWIWSTNDVDPQGLVKEVQYEDGYIRFSIGEGKGNALIGAFDANGNVLWSWHLWMTDKPAHQTMSNGTVFMDRNLGATSASPNEPALTYGLKYQWGRKDPFYGGTQNEETGQVFAQANAHTVFNPSTRLAWVALKRNASNGTLEYTHSHPSTFIYTDKGEDGCDWLTVRNDALWSDETTGAKTNNDPCPYGYRVAYDGAWEGCGYWNVADDPIHGGRTYIDETTGDKFWWPLAGTRWGDQDAGLLGYVGLEGVGAIWMRTTINTGHNASCFYYHQGSYMGASYGMYRAYGESVRCTYERGQ